MCAVRRRRTPIIACRRAGRDEASFYVADRSLNTFWGFTGMASLTTGGSTTIALASLVYRNGIVGLWLDLAGALGLALDSDLERGAQPHRGLIECQGGARRAGAQHRERVQGAPARGLGPVFDRELGAQHAGVHEPAVVIARELTGGPGPPAVHDDGIERVVRRVRPR